MIWRKFTRDDLQTALLMGAVFTLGAAVNTLTAISDIERHGVATPLWKPIVWETTGSYGLLLLVPIIAWLARRFPVSPFVRWQNILVHAAAIVPFGLAHSAIMAGSRAAIYALLGETYDITNITANLVYELRKQAFWYVIILLVFSGLRALRSRGAQAPPVPVAGSSRTIVIANGGRRIYLAPEQILWLEAAGNYVVFHTGGGSHEKRGSLAQLLEEIADPRFVRVHRGHAINRDALKSMAALGNGDAEAELEGGARLRVSRRYRAALEGV